ncbi:MAG: Rpn family recombination-promoting nuclease/putative transposase [Deltaproteobacteria bacterium]|nr:Rpn family recombination-promoting nuclease/putative transposase [Deltaproteobacteria bacterium]
MIRTDEAYKNIFANKKIIQNLLQGFIDHGWVKDVDFESLTSVPTEHISDKLDKRVNDYVWKVKIDKRDLFIFIMLEFQSMPQRLMPLRMNIYRNLLYQHLIKSGEIDKRRKLPPVLPLVIYNGERPWKYPTSLLDIIDDFGDELLNLTRNESFILLDINKISAAKLDSLKMKESKNYVSRIFKLEQSGKYDDIISVVAQINLWLEESKDNELSIAMARWFDNVLRPSKINRVKLPRFGDFAEVNGMFAKTIDRMWDEAEEKGIEKGIEKGKLEGRVEEKVLTARNLKKLKVDTETISKATGLTLEEIENL